MATYLADRMAAAEKSGIKKREKLSKKSRIKAQDKKRKNRKEKTGMPKRSFHLKAIM